MDITAASIEGVFVIQLKPHEDHRGFFMRTYDVNLFEEAGIDRSWVQENHSRSGRKGTLRGLHFQRAPYSETKLVRCVRGAVYDVFVDLRKGSETFGKWGGVELSEENKKMVLIPRGFAHGFCTLTHDSEIFYKVDNVYSPDHEGGILWNDADINIDWPCSDTPLLSDKDQQNLTLNGFISQYGAL